MEIFGLAIQIQKPGHQLTAGGMGLQIVHGGDAIVGIVVLGDFVQTHHATVVLLDVFHRASRITGGDLFALGNEVEIVDRFVVLAQVVVALGRATVIVEGHTGREHINEGRALVLDGGLQERYKLLLVARKAAPDESRAELHGDAHEINRAVAVDRALLGLRTGIGRRGELALGQPVDAVVLDQVQHIHAATNGVRELAEAYRGRVTVAGHAEVDQLAVGEIGAGQHRGHTAMHAVETMGAAEKVGRGLRRAADPRQLRDPMGFDGQLKEGLDERAADRVVAAAGAERRDGALVVAAREAEVVDGGLGVIEFRFGDIGHGLNPARGAGCAGDAG